MPLTIDQRFEALSAELDTAIKREQFRGPLSHGIAFGMMVVTIAASAFAGLAGLFTQKIPMQVIGACALIPGIMALTANTFKPQGRCDWHNQRLDGLIAIKRRLLFQLPEVVTADHLAAIASAMTKLDEDMNKEWADKLGLSWGVFDDKRKTSTVE